MSFAIDVSVEDGKYRYTMTEHGTVTCYRHGDPWPQRQAQGDGMLMALAAEVQDLRAKADEGTDCYCGGGSKIGHASGCPEADHDRLVEAATRLRTFIATDLHNTHAVATTVGLRQAAGETPIAFVRRIVDAYLAEVAS
jgi:hypothetical protein